MEKIKNKLIYVVAGEASGDLHASFLMKEILSCSKNPILFRGVGGPLMQKQGLVSICDFDKLNVMGFAEIIKHLFFFIKLKNKTINDIIQSNPSKIILVDYPGFNLRLAKAIKKNTSIPIIYYISPQLWAWKENRIQVINKYVNQMVVVFPFEVDWYFDRDVQVNYFGHPLLDRYKKPSKNFDSNKGLSIGLFPGSRPQEIKKHVPILRRVIVRLKSQFKKINFVVGVVNPSHQYLFKELGLKEGECQTIVNNSFHAFDLSDFAIVASGTATLECAITNTPFVVIYKTSFISWVITSFFLKVRFASIVNILVGKGLVVECLQKNCNPSFIVSSLLKLINNPQDDLLLQLNSLTRSLGDGQSYNKTAKFILNQ